MTLPLPNLDDHTYNSLVEQAIAQIPLEYPEWTDHNPTDTGIILIELLAWLTEMTLYQVNQIPDNNYASFLSLLKGEKWNFPDLPALEKKKHLQSEIQNTLLELRRTYRAVTAADYEKLVLEDWNQSPESANLKILRVKCLAERNLSPSDAETVAKGHISQGHISLVVITEDLVVITEDENNKTDNKYEKLLNFLNERKLLTTRLHIVEPVYIPVSIEAEVVIVDGAAAEDVKKRAEEEVELFFHRLKSGKYWQGKGWRFGRGVYLSELYKLLDDLEGVDYVENLQIKDKDNNSKSEIYLAENQLVEPVTSEFKILVEVNNGYKEI
ncbi:MAG: hypothetical protein RLZZ574_332 [Cyanobacteriota bacterium]|jgi:hypothetical protein